jgi:hypothetical protein
VQFNSVGFHGGVGPVLNVILMHKPLHLIIVLVHAMAN